MLLFFRFVTSYCSWFRNPVKLTSWGYRLVVYPMIYDGFYTIQPVVIAVGSSSHIPGLVAKSALWRWNNSRCRSGTWQKIPQSFAYNPGRFTWNLKITHLERKMIFQTSMLLFHVNLQGCNKKGMEDGTSFWMKFFAIFFGPVLHNLVNSVTQTSVPKKCFPSCSSDIYHPMLPP